MARRIKSELCNPEAEESNGCEYCSGVATDSKPSERPEYVEIEEEEGKLNKR